MQGVLNYLRESLVSLKNHIHTYVFTYIHTDIKYRNTHTFSARNCLPVIANSYSMLFTFTVQFWTKPVYMSIFPSSTLFLTSFLLQYNYICLIKENKFKSKLTGGALSNKDSRRSFRLTNMEGTAITPTK